MTTCEKCPVGKRGQAAAGASTPCIDCGVGAVAAIEGATECTPCEGDTVTFMNYTASACSPCPEGQIADSLHAICSACAKGQYRAKPADSSSNRSACIVCPALGVTCSNGILTLDRQAWYSTEDNAIITEDTVMHACFTAQSCTYKDNALACNTALGYEGVLCGACLQDEANDRIFLRNGRECSECFEPLWNWLVFSGLAGAVVLFVIYIAAFRSTNRRVGEYGGIIRRIAFSYMQMLGVLGIFKARGTKIFNEAIGKTSQIAGGSPTSLLPIKCLLNSQAYAPFLVNMALPPIFALLVALVILPASQIKRAQERAAARKAIAKALRRARGAVADDAADPHLPPQHEPVVDLDHCCCKLPTKVALKLPCCRRVASEEYIENAARAFQGLPPNPPAYRALLDIDARALGGVPHAFLTACKRCRVATRADERNAWRAAEAVRAQRAPFKPFRRFVAVMVLVMYSLYPTLVASTAAMFNCSADIEGKRYLLADLSAECYTGWHLVFVISASFSVAVYCLGTPLVLASILVMDCCVCSRPAPRHGAAAEEGEARCSQRRKCACVCTLRSSTPWGFRTAPFRERFGLLVAGYDTARGPIVMAWEPLVVMLRKLFITLAGSLIRDPYIQIISALAILVASLTLQALVQVSVLLCTVTYYANRAHNLTRSP
jgi:hypothetical protein